MLSTGQLNIFKKSFESALELILTRQSSGNSYLDLLEDAISYCALSGGKRIRPLLVYSTNQLLGGEMHNIHAAAVAIELIHTYSLVHDDLPDIDNDDLRRGRPTAHKKYGNATAILTGDALQTLAFNVIAQNNLNIKSANKRLQMLEYLSSASGFAGMVGGQMIDVNSNTKHELLDFEQLVMMHSLKTGSLFDACIVLPIIANNANSKQEHALMDYIANLGLAFQIADDILDYTKNTEQLGKTSGKDAKAYKNTFISLLGLDASKRHVQDLCTGAVQALNMFDKNANNLRQIAKFISVSIE